MRKEAKVKTPNPEQAAVIGDLSSNLLLIASAGTGKTYTVARRIERILKEGLAKPNEVLCLTFTIKACGEMREDILSGCPQAAGVEIKTIHGFCRKLLAEEGRRTSPSGREPVVCDEVDEEEILGRLFSRLIPVWDMERAARERYSLTLEEVLSRDVVSINGAPLSAGGAEGFYRRMDDGSYFGAAGILPEEIALPLLRASDPARTFCPDCGSPQRENGNFCHVCGFDFRTYIPPRKFALGKYGRYRDLVSLLKHERALFPFGDEEADYTAAFARLKEREPEKLKRAFSYRMGYEEEFDRVFWGKAERYMGALMRAYGEELRESGRLDFDDLIIGARDLLRNGAVCSRVQARYRFIVVDETQDTSVLEYDVLKRLFAHARVMLCGDFFQTIYEWRGSRPFDVAEDFCKTFGAKTYTLTQNYRATRTLAEAAYGFLRNAYPKGEKFLPESYTVQSGEEGEPVRFVRCLGAEAEEKFIFRYLTKHRGENVCVMARSNRYIEGLFRKFDSLNCDLPPEKRLSFFAAGDFRLFKSAAVKDMLALFALLLDPDDIPAAERIAEKYLHGVGAATLAAVREGGRAGLAFSSFLTEETYGGDPYRTLLRAEEEGRIVVYDTETTGLDLACDEPIQIAAVSLGREGREEFMRFVLPTREISAGALRTHGYSLEYLREHGAISQKEALEAFSEFVRGCVIVGHNGKRFDRPLLERALRDCGLPPLPAEGEYDTLELSRILMPELPDHKLSTLCAALGVTNERAHDAFADVAATEGVLARLLARLKPQTGVREKLVRRCAEKFKPLYAARLALNACLDSDDADGLFDRAEEAFSFSARCEKSWEKENPALLRMLVKEKAGEMPLRKALQELLAESALSGSELDALAKKLDRIPIVTVHQSKGCEFDTVILAGADEYLFPLAAEDGREEEEKRVFYVAITRAKKRLLITCRGSGAARSPSPYLDLIPRECLERYESDGTRTERK